MQLVPVAAGEQQQGFVGDGADGDPVAVGAVQRDVKRAHAVAPRQQAGVGRQVSVGAVQRNPQVFVIVVEGFHEQGTDGLRRAVGVRGGQDAPQAALNLAGVLDVGDGIGGLLWPLERFGCVPWCSVVVGSDLRRCG